MLNAVMSAVVKITVMALKISPICLIYFDKLMTVISIRLVSLLDGSANSGYKVSHLVDQMSVGQLVWTLNHSIKGFCGNIVIFRKICFIVLAPGTFHSDKGKKMEFFM